MKPFADVAVPMTLAALLAAPAFAGLYGDPPDATHAWAMHDMNRPRPAVVKPGDAPGQPPSDAVVLFDGTSLDQWEQEKDGGTPPKWRIVDGAMEVVKGTGTLRTKQSFGDCQLHIEWRTPAEVSGSSQGRGNSGVFLMGTYELQVLDCYNNDTYPDGQAGSIYGENPPLVNVCRGPGEWQTYDVIFHQPVWDGDTLARPGSVTVLQNGVLVQDHWLIEGTSTHKVRTKPRKHDKKLPFKLQDHGNPTRFRNIWIREIPDYEGDYTTGAYRKPEAIAALQRKTAAKVRQEGEQMLAGGDAVGGMQKLMEALSYDRDEAARAKLEELANAYVGEVRKLDAKQIDQRKNEIKGVLHDLDYLAKFGIVPDGFAPRQALHKLADERGLMKK